MLLTLLIFLPVLFAAVVFMLPEARVRIVSLILGSLYFLLSLALLARFDKTTEKLQLVEKVNWIPSIGVQYFVGIDGISLWLVLLTALLLPLTVLASWNSIQGRLKTFHAHLFLLTSAVVGTFLAMDLVLFYLFFEVSLIPMYFIIGIWGGARRLYATVKFFIYTMAGSLFMLAAVVVLLIMSQEQLGYVTADLTQLYKLTIPFVANEWFNTQSLLFFAFSLAFAIKVPMFPVHTWLPDAHVEAPTPGSVFLAAVMLKMGTYGFMRIVIPMFSESVEAWGWLFMVLAVIGIIYGALVALVQTDVKKLVAYSSVSHMGYVMLGLFALNSYGLTGSLYQMLNHGVSTGALFLLVGMIYERTHTREISRYGGIAPHAPWFTVAFLIVTFSSIAVPLTNGFIGEFLILLGTFEYNKIYGVFAVTGVVLGAAYMLWMVKRVFFGAEGEVVRESHGHSLDMTVREWAVITPFIILIFWMGLFPNHFLSWSKTSVEYLQQNHRHYDLSQIDKGETLWKSASR